MLQSEDVDPDEMLKEQIRQELMMEDEAFKHLSKEDIQRIIDEAEGVYLFICLW